MKSNIYRTVVVIAVATFTATPVPAQTLGDVERRLDRLESQVSIKVRPSGRSDQQPAISNDNYEKIMRSFTELSERLQIIERQIAITINNSEKLDRMQIQLGREINKLKMDTELQINNFEKKLSSSNRESVDLQRRDNGNVLAHDVKQNKFENDVKFIKIANDYFTNKKWSQAEYAYLEFIATYPKSKRIVEAQYKLGRSYMAKANYTESAKIFLDIYQKRPSDTFAPGALLGLGQSLYMLQPEKNGQSCGVYNEIDKIYISRLSEDQKLELQASKNTAQCN